MAHMCSLTTVAHREAYRTMHLLRGRNRPPRAWKCETIAVAGMRRFFSPKDWGRIAQGTALGPRLQPPPSLKGWHMPVPAFQAGGSPVSHTQGGALGYPAPVLRTESSMP